MLATAAPNATVPETRMGYHKLQVRGRQDNAAEFILESPRSGDKL